MTFDAEAATLQGAINAMLDKVEATKRASYESGFTYGERITPTYYQVTRYFFNSPKKKLGAGVRYSEVGDWNNAIREWTKVVDNGKLKDAGRAAYNIAVGYEVLGDMEKAKEWAARSHTEFQEKDADEYYKTLCNRINEERLVSQH
jgi:tetratricopeptide (TPR) repeat protein